MMPLQEHGIRQSAAASLQPQRASNVMGMSLQPWQISTKSVNHVPAAHKPPVDQSSSGLDVYRVGLIQGNVPAVTAI